MGRRGTSVLWRRAAAVVSFLGHPLLTVPAFTAYQAWQRLPSRAGGWVVGSVVAVVVALSLWNLRKTRRGTYSNFDVSERQQRQAFYPVLLGLLGVATAVLFWQATLGPFRAGLLAVWGLLGACYGLNRWLKVSLHAALSFFLAGTLLFLQSGWGAPLALAAATLVAISRWVLGRHTVAELLAGAALGLLASGSLQW